MPTRTLIQAGFDPNELTDLDRYRRKQTNPPTRARAVHDLVLVALRDAASLPDNHRRRLHDSDDHLGCHTAKALRGAMTAPNDDRPTSPK
jgi:hypothetical protein